GTLLCALDFHLGPAKEVVVIGDRRAARPLLEEIWSRFVPNKVLAGAGNGDGSLESPMLEGKQASEGEPTAFVCENYSCKSPTTDPAELVRHLAGS
ncbi:MAG: thioredoxin domain-containing protein, partial [Actinomycetota bacterium]